MDAIGSGKLGLVVSTDSAEFAGVEVFGRVEGLDRLIGIQVIRVILPSIASSEMFRDEPRDIFGDGWAGVTDIFSEPVPEDC
jgi:hypothetical protein